MSRIARYKESLNRFIKEKSEILNINKKENETEEIKRIYEKIKKSDKILSIILLTIMNSQNKKKKAAMQGYYAAASIEYIIILIKIIDDKKIEEGEKYKIIMLLLNEISESIKKNVESISNYISKEETYEMMIEIIEKKNKLLNYNNILNKYKFKIEEEEIDNKIIKWYFKNNEEAKKRIKKIKKIKKESMKEYIKKKYISVSELAFTIGWILGSGKKEKKENIKSISKNFGMLYKLTKDFQNIERDYYNSEEITNNYIVNYGIQNAHEEFMKNKHIFIEKAMRMNIYTGTIQEIVNKLENIIDEIIDETSPDIISNLSNMTNEEI